MNHSTAVNLIYQASITVWVFGILYPILDYGPRAIMAGQSPPQDPPSTVAAAPVAAIISVLGVWAFFQTLGLQKNDRKEEMRTAAKEAMGIIVGLSRQITLDDAKWQKAFGYLATVNSKTLHKDKKERKRKEDEEKRKLMSKEEREYKEDEDELKRWEAKARNYIREYAGQKKSTYSIAEWDIEVAAYLAAHLTDLLVLWYETMYRKLMIEGGKPAENEKPQDPPPTI